MFILTFLLIFLSVYPMALCQNWACLLYLFKLFSSLLPVKAEEIKFSRSSLIAFTAVFNKLTFPWTSILGVELEENNTSMLTFGLMPFSGREILRLDVAACTVNIRYYFFFFFKRNIKGKRILNSCQNKNLKLKCTYNNSNETDVDYELHGSPWNFGSILKK